MSETIQLPIQQGQRDVAHSLPVTIASDQPAIPVATTIVGVATEVTLDAIKTLVNSLQSDVADGVKIDPTDLATLVGYIDNLETLITSTNSKLDTLIAKDYATQTTLASVLVDTTAIKNKTAAVFFTKSYDQIVPSVTATEDVYTTKLLGVTQQTLTVTYSDSTKSTVTNYQVV